MVNIVCSPAWFCSINVLLHMLFVCIALMVSYSYYRAYKLTKNSSFLSFSVGFLLVNLAYITKVIIDLFTLPGLVIRIHLEHILEIFSILYLLYMVFTFLGYAMFAVAHSKAKDKDIYVLLVALLGLLLVESFESPLFFNITAIVLISFVLWHSFNSFFSKKNINAGLVTGAFSCIALSHLFFIANLLGLTAGLAHLLGYTFNLIGFILLLVMLARIYYGRQKKPC